jgi:hypothetical protein
MLILTVGSQVFAVEANSWKSEVANAQHPQPALVLNLPISKENLQSNSIVTAVIPLVPVARPSITLYNPVSVDSITLLAEGDPQTWGIVGRGFDNVLVSDSDTRIVADTEHSLSKGNLKLTGENLLAFTVPKASVDNVKNVSVQLGKLPTVVLAAPKSTTPVKVSINGAPPTAPVGSAPAVEFSGEHFEQVTNVTFGGTNLIYYADSNGQKLHVFLTRAVTSQSGPVALPVQTKDGSVQIANINVQ